MAGTGGFLRGAGDVASYLGVSYQTALALLNSGMVPTTRIGRSWLVSPDALRRAIEEGTAAPITTAAGKARARRRAKMGIAMRG